MITAILILASLSALFGAAQYYLGREFKSFDRMEDAAVGDWRRSL